ncbi:MAG: helix-turn-helix transcriptional regulator [Campylobacterota bacterium]|nr:helix-turn-helix transcriptional regulator [Campylobacterota bacterium]
MSNNKLNINESVKLLIKSIRGERIALNLTQKEFSNLIGLKFATYRSFEQTGKISLENFIIIMAKLNKSHEFINFINSFEFSNEKERSRVDIASTKTSITNYIVPISQKQITLDKKIFGEELFFSVENGHLYDVGNFITILLSKYNDKRLILLLRYFGKERVMPYVLKEKNIDLLKKFNKHISMMER